MKKKRTYNTRLIKCGRSYTIQGIAKLYQIHSNAVDRWIDAGLECIDSVKPKRIHGSDLKTFLDDRQTKRKKPCKIHEAFCCKCRKPQAIWENVIDLIIRNQKQLTITGLCAVCSTSMYKGGSIKKLPEYHKLFNVQTVQR